MMSTHPPAGLAVYMPGGLEWLVYLAFVGWMLGHAITHQVRTADKIIWVLVILLLPLVGPIAYFVFSFILGYGTPSAKDAPAGDA